MVVQPQLSTPQAQFPTRGAGLSRARMLTLASIAVTAAVTTGLWAVLAAALPTGRTSGDLTRSSGLVLLILFTATIVLGQLTAARVGATGWPGFVVQSLHRNVSMLAVALLIVHIAAPVIGGYLGLRLSYAFVPFVPAQVRIWTRLAASAADLILLTAVASAARVRAGYRFWRAVHLTAYLAWLLAMVHAAGIGTDRISVLTVEAVCAGAVGWASWHRLRAARRPTGRRRP